MDITHFLAVLDRSVSTLSNNNFFTLEVRDAQPDCIFDANHPVIADLFNAAQKLLLGNISSEQLQRVGIFRDYPSKSLTYSELNDPQLLVVEHKEFTFSFLGEEQQVHVYKRY